MTIPSLLVSSVSSVSNFRNLVLFICLLFGDGHFRNGHILYDSKVFDSDFAVQIESICPDQIPWHNTDITQPSLLPWNIGERNDHILQLIFFDPENLAKEIEEFKDFFTFYGIYVFCSTGDEISKMERISHIKKLTPKSGNNNSNDQFGSAKSGSSTLVLHYDVINGSIDVDWASNGNDATAKSEKRMSVDTERNSDRNTKIDGMDTFDVTFGEYERMQPVAIRTIGIYKRSDMGFELDPTIPLLFVTNYFNSMMDKSYLNMTCIIFVDSTTVSYGNQVVTHGQRKQYKDLHLQYNSATGENALKLSEEHSYDLHFSSYLFTVLFPYDRGTMIYPLYPYASTDLGVVFVYGQDFTRRMNIILIPESIQTIAGVIAFFMSFAAFILFLMRRWLNLRWADPLSTFLDIMIVFFGGGNLRDRHRFERWFYGILTIGAYFIVAIFSDNLLECVMRILNHEVKTFEQMAEINPPIYISPFLGEHGERIQAMLRGKMGPDVIYKGLVSKNNNPGSNSFAWVLKMSDAESFGHDPNDGIDYDILQEILGSISSQYYLESNHYVPKRMLKKIDKATSSMIESGLAKFYLSIAEFLNDLKARESQDDDDIQALTLQQLKRPMILIFCLWGVATIFLILEFIVFKWNQWQNR